MEIIELAEVESVVVVVIGCGTKVTGSVLAPPADDITEIEDEGTVVFTTSAPVASSVPSGSVGRLVLAESVGFADKSLDSA